MKKIKIKFKKPYIKKICTINGFEAWYVNGSWIRKNINKEFTNYAANYFFKFIPKNEFWIDKEYSRKEYNYYLKFLITREKLIKQGKNPKQAKKIAELAEKNLRNSSKIIQNLKKLSKKQLISKIHKKFLKKYSNKKIKTWIVNGFFVRSLFFLDFTAGGHEFVYNFIPKNEIWIDNALDKKEIDFVVLHELHERALMKIDNFNESLEKRYNKAHKKASKFEFSYRTHKKDIKKAIKLELEKL